MELLILGMGCPRCKKLAENAEQAVKELGISGYTLEETTDKQRIESFGVSSLPALVVDGKVVSSGQILEVEAIKPLLKDPEASANKMKMEQAKEETSNQGRRVVAFIVLVVLVGLAIYAGTQDVAKQNNVEEAIEAAASVAPTVAPSAAASVVPVVKSELK